MQVLSRLTRLARHLDRARRAAFAVYDLESWEFDVLAALRRAGPPYRLTPGQLVRETMVTSGTMTNRVDRLSQRGLVVRDDHPDDRRGVLVTLTAAGRESADAAMSQLLIAEHALLANLPAAEHGAPCRVAPHPPAPIRAEPIRSLSPTRPASAERPDRDARVRPSAAHR